MQQTPTPTVTCNQINIARNGMQETQSTARAIMGLSSRAGTVGPSHSNLYQPGLRSFWQFPVGASGTCRPGLLFDFSQPCNIAGLEIGLFVAQELIFLHVQRLYPLKDSRTIPSNFFSRFVDGQIFWPMLVRLFTSSHIRFLQSWLTVAIVPYFTATRQLSIANVLTSVVYLSYNKKQGCS